MELSIVIVNWNVKDLLAQCLTSIYSSSNYRDIEVIVIDNASTDGSGEMIKSEFPQVKLIVNKRNCGFAASCNQGIRVAHKPFILFLNPDTVILSLAMERTLDFLKTTPKAGIVGCKILNPDGSLQYSCRSFPSFWNYFFESFFLYKLFPKNHFIGNFYMTNFSYDKIREVDVVLGAFMMCSKKTLDEVGYFDERFFMYSEETDLCYRIREHDFRVYFFPDAEIIHYSRASASQYPTEMFKQDHRSRFLFMRKHYSSLDILLSLWVIFCGVFLRILYWGMCSGYTFLFKKQQLKNSIIKLKVFINLFIWYMELGFVK
jgi:GT2 family glycosyltransferase